MSNIKNVTVLGTGVLGSQERAVRGRGVARREGLRVVRAIGQGAGRLR